MALCPRRRNQAAVTPTSLSAHPGARLRRLFPLALLLLTACGSTPPPPDWKMNTQASLESFEKYFLNGQSKLADNSFAKARAEASRTGRPDLIARLELARCGVRAAALEFGACEGYELLKSSAGEAERAYADFLAGNWRDLENRPLSPQYLPLLSSGSDSDQAPQLTAMVSPISRLIAAGVLFHANRITPAGIEIAIATASEQGWRRPLLAWLKIQLARAELASNREAAAAIRTRIGLVENTRN